MFIADIGSQELKNMKNLFKILFACFRGNRENPQSSGTQDDLNILPSGSSVDQEPSLSEPIAAETTPPSDCDSASITSASLESDCAPPAPVAVQQISNATESETLPTAPENDCDCDTLESPAASDEDSVVADPGLGYPVKEKPIFKTLISNEGVFNEMVSLEFVTVDSDGIHGHILVQNTCYEKKVSVRYTENEWMTFEDCAAGWMETVNEGAMDRFTFTLPAGDSVAETSFAISFNGKWDNNKGDNYTVVFTM